MLHRFQFHKREPSQTRTQSWETQVQIGTRPTIVLPPTSRPVLKSFTVFPDLPLEIRRKVWTAVVLDSVEYSGDGHVVQLKIREYVIGPSVPQRGMINANKESRHQSIFLAGESINLSGYHADRPLYCSPRSDTLYLNNEFCRFVKNYMFDPFIGGNEKTIGKTTSALRVLRESTSDADRSKIKRLAIDLEVTCNNSFAAQIV
jgi:hypothetical protein